MEGDNLHNASSVRAIMAGEAGCPLVAPQEEKYLLPYHHLPLMEWGPRGCREAGAFKCLAAAKRGPEGMCQPWKMERPRDGDPRGRKFPKHPSLSINPPSHAPGAHTPAAPQAFLEEEVLLLAGSCSQEAGEPGCSCPGGGHVQTQRQHWKGENT